ncbi:hypothetical protein HCA69_07855 [Listeria grandensis]|uniref:Uncharacterized protein n=1 Tax=Listeria grandensis TaxID=1494963 RepID=A0A7X1CPS6_9LIST|nr:hypothetical protein [Listeria grandensis]MBC1936277.1 hypothetical protein [Listeria grandensis]
MENEFEAPKKQVNGWKWSTIIVSIVSVITISFMGFALFNQNQAGMNGQGNMPTNGQSQMGGSDETYGTPPSGAPGQQQGGGSSGSSDDTDADTGASLSPGSDSTDGTSSNSL